MFTEDNKKEFDKGIKSLLDEHGIPKNTESYQDYERAKRILPVMPWYLYNRAIRLICRRVGI